MFVYVVALVDSTHVYGEDAGLCTWNVSWIPPMWVGRTHLCVYASVPWYSRSVNGGRVCERESLPRSLSMMGGGICVVREGVHQSLRCGGKTHMCTPKRPWIFSKGGG